MKKSLVTLVVLVGSIALAGTVFAGLDWACYEMPKAKVDCKNSVLCAGTAKGACPLGCGPCAPMVTFSGRWLTVAKCPDAPKPAAKAKPAPDTFWAMSKGAELCCGVKLPAEAKKAAAPKAGAKKAPKK